ncbi:MAG: ABC transporter permease [Rhodothermales bacterium]
MLRNQIKTALRALTKRPGLTTINVLGLAVGLACCLLIGLYLLSEWHFDRFHENSDRIVYIAPNASLNGAPPVAWWSSPGPLGPLLQDEVPQVEQAVRVYADVAILSAGSSRHFFDDIAFVDAPFFDFFDLPFTTGNPATALTVPNGLVLTASSAKLLFGNDNPLNQPVQIDAEHTLTVTGVLADPPPNTHFQHDAYIPMTYQQQHGPEWLLESWGNAGMFTYLMLRPDANLDAMHATIDEVIQPINDMLSQAGLTYEMRAEQFADLHLFSERFVDETTARRRNLYLFAGIALFILLIAGINFVNLTTARSLERAKEVGIRKVAGAERGTLVRQFLLESVVTSLLALGLALVLAEVLLPAFEMVAGRAVLPSLLTQPSYLLGFAAAALAVGVVAGSYPAFVLSGFAPAQVLKGAFRRSKQGRGLRRALVVTQFAISITLIAATAVVQQQLTHLQSHDLGFQQEQVLTIDFGRNADVIAQLPSIKEALIQVPGVRGVAGSSAVPSTRFTSAIATLQNVSQTDVDEIVTSYAVDYDFLDVYDLDLVAGRGFDEARVADPDEAMLVNEALVRQLGYADPQDALGTTFRHWGSEGTIVGVLRDFNYQSLRGQIRPLALRVNDGFGQRFLSLPLATADVQRTVQALEAEWNALLPHYPFLYSFLDDRFDALYRDEQQFGRLFLAFAVLAIFIACLGLFGLATYTTQQRTKEIGVRKVLGATVPSLLVLLSKDFLKLVLLALGVALPIIWLGSTAWLEEFAYRTTLGPGIFLLAGGLALGIALLTVSYQAFRTASSNPADALRYE